jgi:hypothetical protein
MIIALVVVIVFLPKEYNNETGIDIRTSREAAFSKAQDLSRWHTAAIMNGISLDNFDIPKDINSHVQIPGINVDTMLTGIKDAAQSLKMRIRLVKSESPTRIIYIVEGGPLNGMQPEVLFFELDGNNTKVTIKESFTFTGLWAGLRVIMVRVGMNKLNSSSLETLKKLCEQTP